jgi:hypothetical protein
LERGLLHPGVADAWNEAMPLIDLSAKHTWLRSLSHGFGSQKAADDQKRRAPELWSGVHGCGRVVRGLLFADHHAFARGSGACIPGWR